MGSKYIDYGSSVMRVSQTMYVRDVKLGLGSGASFALEYAAEFFFGSFHHGMNFRSIHLEAFTGFFFHITNPGLAVVASHDVGQVSKLLKQEQINRQEFFCRYLDIAANGSSAEGIDCSEKLAHPINRQSRCDSHANK